MYIYVAVLSNRITQLLLINGLTALRSISLYIKVLQRRNISLVVYSWLGGVVAMLLDLRLAVVGSNPGHGIAVFSDVGDRFFRVNYLGM